MANHSLKTILKIIMPNKKIFILLPDGVGLRNFAYSNFYDLGIKEGFDVVFWNNTPFSLTDQGFKEIQIHDAKVNPWTDIFKNVKIQAELNCNIKKTKDHVYDGYRFPFSYGTIKSAIKSLMVQGLTVLYASENGLRKIRKKLIKQNGKQIIIKTACKHFKKKNLLWFSVPIKDTVSVAPLLAAQDLGIPTAAFIFSWDNLPKATMVVETDYYFVWSEHMKNELFFYYPYIKNQQFS